MTDFPRWELDGRTFKTVRGLLNYLIAKHDAASVSMVRAADRSLSVYGDDGLEVARYYVSEPETGKAMAVTISHCRKEAA